MQDKNEEGREREGEERRNGVRNRMGKKCVVLLAFITCIHLQVRIHKENYSEPL